MRFALVSLGLMGLLVVSVSLSGCGPKSGDTGKAAAADGCEVDGHDHSTCSGSHDDGDQHPSEGPHGGYLIELGDEEYHAELLRDEKTNTVTIHLLDGPAKKSVAVAQPEITLQLLRDGKFVKYALQAVKGEDAASKDVASEFTIVDKGLVEAFCHDAKTQGRLQVTINGKPYSGNIKLSCHDHDGHGDHGSH